MNENSINYDDFVNRPEYDEFGFKLTPEELKEKKKKEFLEKDASNQAFEEWRKRKGESEK